MSQNRSNRGKGVLVALGGLLSAFATAVAVVLTLGRGLRRRDGAEKPRPAEDAAATPLVPTPSSSTVRPESGVRTPVPGQESTQGASAIGLPLHPGWHMVDEALPAPTYWPVVMAVGITLIAWGVVTTPLISGAGLVLFALALAGWIGDLRRERHES